MNPNLQEHSYFIINRFDHYFDSVNNKGNFLLSFNTIIIGAIAATHKIILKHIEKSWDFVVIILLVIMVALCFAAIFHTLHAIYPYLKNKREVEESNKSLIFFKSIAKIDEDDFLNEFKRQTKEKIDEDLLIQIHQLSKGLNYKYEHLSKAGLCIYGQVFIAFLIILLDILV